MYNIPCIMRIKCMFTQGERNSNMKVSSYADRVGGFVATNIGIIEDCRMEEADFSVYDSGGEGLYRRFYRAVQDSCTVTEILEKAKTKRYTYARLRRFLLAAYLNLELPRGVPPYIRLLAANETGRILLRKMKKNGVPVLTKVADVAKLGPEAEKLLRAEARRTDLYTLAFPNKYQSHCGAEWRCRPILL